MKTKPNTPAVKPPPADSTLNRRAFIRATAQAAVAVSALSAAPYVARGQVLGANSKLGVGFIGVGGRGRSHVNTVKRLILGGEPLQITAVCDAWQFRREEVAQQAKAKAYARHQELLADPNVDVVCIATPDRLHVPQALDAIRAGKDVYCEKPMGHWSQTALSKAFCQETKRLKRVVQIGNQGNSSRAWQIVGELVRQGVVGRPQIVQAGYFRDGDWGERMPIPDRTARPGPELDWEGFLGDAPKVPFTVDRFFSWRKYLDYAGGPCTDLFPHVITPFVGILGLDFPSLAVASGGIFKYDTYDREVPDTFNLCLDYPDRLSVTLVCTLANECQTEPSIRGDEGTITLQGPVWELGFDSVTVVPRKGQPTKIPGDKSDSVLAHWKNFLSCVRSRQQPVADVEFGYRVQVALNMALLGFLQTKVATFNRAQEEIVLS